MRWFHGKATKYFAVPEIPDDKQDRDLALMESQQRLVEALEKQKRAIPVTESLRQQNIDNHYIQRLELSYGKRLSA